MIEFHAGTGPDTQAIGIALEEMFLDYRIMPGRAPLPVIAIGGARVVGAPNILPALARKTGRFLPEQDISAFLSRQQLDTAELAERLSAADYIFGRFSIADMSAYPKLINDRAVRTTHAAIDRWATRMSQRSATGRGMSVMSK